MLTVDYLDFYSNENRTKGLINNLGIVFIIIAKYGIIITIIIITTITMINTINIINMIDIINIINVIDIFFLRTSVQLSFIIIIRS